MAGPCSSASSPARGSWRPWTGAAGAPTIASSRTGLPREVRLRSDDGRVDLVASLQQLEVNTTIDDAAFEVEIPPGTEAMTLDELRSVAPLRTP